MRLLSISMVVRYFYGEKTITSPELNSLIFPHSHGALLTRRRSEMMISRVRLVALMFAILTPLWVIIDAMFLPWPLWGWMSVQRIVVSIAFGLLVRYYPQTSLLRDAYRALALLFVIPSLFYISSNMTLVYSGYVMYTNPALVGYAFLPFVMLAGMSIFPLTFLEGMCFAAPAVLAQFFSIVFDFSFSAIGWGEVNQVATVWLLFLIASVATLAGMSQLHLMRRLTDQASWDVLTKCFNRASGEELLSIYFAAAQQRKQPFSLVFIDIDHFKEVNDQYGHEAGDEVLKMAARRLQQHIGEKEMLIRWGGEEFVILKPGMLLARAVECASALQVEGLGIRPDGRPLTASVGIAEYQRDQVTTLQALIELADHRMYMAKRSGRNQIVWDTHHHAAHH